MRQFVKKHLMKYVIHITIVHIHIQWHFWGETEWQNELDWLALNGVNAVLDITGQEEVWRRFLSEFGILN